MGMPATDDRITTIDDLLALPDDGLRHELLDGIHVVTPAPSYQHQVALSVLFSQLADQLRGWATLEVLWSPADLVLGKNTLVQPDIFVLELEPGQTITSWKEAPVPVLVVEALSASTAQRDRGVKRRTYQRAGVAQYWIIDVDARLVERWTPQDERPEICDSVLRWKLPNGAEGEIHLPPLFGKIVGR